MEDTHKVPPSNPPVPHVRRRKAIALGMLVIFLIGAVWYVMFGSTNLDEWKSTSSYIDGLGSVHIIYPSAVARGVEDHLTVLVENSSSNDSGNISVLILGNGNLWFQDGNRADQASLPIGSAEKRVLAFTVSNALPDSAQQLTTTVLVKFIPTGANNTGAILPLQVYLQDTPQFHISRAKEIGIRLHLIAANLYGISTSLATLIGAIASFLAGIVLALNRQKEISRFFQRDANIPTT